MKIYISSDIEGTSGASNWDEALDTAHHKFLGPPRRGLRWRAARRRCLCATRTPAP